jgi:hypothetical protein
MKAKWFFKNDRGYLTWQPSLFGVCFVVEKCNVVNDADEAYKMYTLKVILLSFVLNVYWKIRDKKLDRIDKRVRRLG